MSEKPTPIAITATEVPARSKPSVYPEPFASRMVGREKRQLGDLFGLTNFGGMLTRLAPSAVSALRHAHTRQDEFIFILKGHPTLHTDEGRTQLCPGMCAGFKAAQAMDTAWSMKPPKRLSISKSATEHRETKEAIPMTTSKPCSLRENGSSSTRMARPMGEVGAKHLRSANPVLVPRDARNALW